jgi:hypothetical protein
LSGCGTLMPGTGAVWFARGRRLGLRGVAGRHIKTVSITSDCLNEALDGVSAVLICLILVWHIFRPSKVRA